MTPSEILMKHEDANEYHFHEVDRKWIIEAMEEYATLSKKETVEKEKSEIPTNLYTEEQVLNALRLAHSHIKPLQYVVDTLTPIELPTDEEIEEGLFHQSNEYAYGYKDAFQLMRNKIQNK